MRKAAAVVNSSGDGAEALQNLVTYNTGKLTATTLAQKIHAGNAAPSTQAVSFVGGSGTGKT